jgi:coenzyme Q-binding protein COQ10
MPQHSEQRVLPFRPEQLFDLVADIESYPQFLPWCIGARIRRRDGNVLLADLVIGFKMVRERYTSRVTLTPKHRIDVAYVDGPLKRLTNCWTFSDHERGCLVDFHVDFEFRSRVLQALVGALFHEAFRRMVASFEQRATQIYGKLEPTPPAVANAGR